MPKLSDLLWDYVPDKQAFQGMGNDLLAAANRGGVAAVLRAPVDIANQDCQPRQSPLRLRRNKAGLSADQMPQLEDKPIGGSEWIGQKMQDAGLINNNQERLAELLAGWSCRGDAERRGEGRPGDGCRHCQRAEAEHAEHSGIQGAAGGDCLARFPHDIQPNRGQVSRSLT